MNIDRNFSNKDSYINNIGLISPIDLDENEEDVSLFEHRGKPDPKNVRKREEQKRRGELRRKNAEKRRLEMEKRKNKKSSSETQNKEQTKEPKKEEKQTKEYDFKEEQKNKQQNTVLSNEKVDEVKQHISDSKSKCNKVVKSIKTKNKKQKDIVDDIEKSITTITKEVETNMNDGKDVDMDDIIDREYKSIVEKHQDTEVDDEDDWGDLGKLDSKEEDFAKQFDKGDNDDWGDLGKQTTNKKSNLYDWGDDDEDDDYKKSYYEKKLQKLQKKYHEDIDNFEGTPQERKAIVEKYKKDKAKINQRIKETEIQDWQGFKQKKQQDKKKRREELRKNPVVNWIRMAYFKSLYPFYNAKEKIKSGINWLYGFDE